jgi:hypothetical protein
MHDRSALHVQTVCVGEFILHDHDGCPVARLSFAGCGDTPSGVEGHKGLCLFLNTAAAGSEPTWQHFGTVGLSREGEPVLGLTMGGEHLEVDFCELKTLLGGEK